SALPSRTFSPLRARTLREKDERVTRQVGGKGLAIISLRSTHRRSCTRTSLLIPRHGAGVDCDWSARHDGAAFRPGHITPRLTVDLPLWNLQRSMPITAEAGGSSPPRPTTQTTRAALRRFDNRPAAT